MSVKGKGAKTVPAKSTKGKKGKVGEASEDITIDEFKEMLGELQEGLGDLQVLAGKLGMKVLLRRQ